MSRLLIAALLAALALLGGCDQLGLESASAVAERKLAEGKAVGGACRHAGRAIEDCYTLNRRVDKASIYAGWREMDDYMRENKLSPVAPVIPLPETRSRTAEADDAAPEAAASQATKADRPPKAERLAKADKGEASEAAVPPAHKAATAR